MTVFRPASRIIEPSGLMLPSLGFGGAALGGLFSSVDQHVAMETLKSAFNAGINYVDTAPFYGLGRSERVVGDVLRGRDYILSTKVGRLLKPGAMADPASLGWPDALPFHPVFDYTYDGIMRSVEDSFQRLGLDRIDILYVHDIGEATHGNENNRHFNDLKNSGYRALAQLRESSVVRAIGLGVNEIAICRDALGIGAWDIFLLAGRYTLLEQGALDDLFPECHEAGTSIVIGGPYNSGILVSGDTWNYGAAPESVVQKVAALKQVSADYGVPLPAAALQFPMGHPLVISVVPGLRSPEELTETLNLAQHDIPKEFWSALKSREFLHPDAPVPGNRPFEKPRQ